MNSIITFEMSYKDLVFPGIKLRFQEYATVPADVYIAQYLY